ncbi:MAG TPA: hypothetical protein VNF00_01055, partial [Candidatus Acidoferrales bacterium]|nr:hypothetical protein [Candidatus Acidoferrales bacterium]
DQDQQDYSHDDYCDNDGFLFTGHGRPLLDRGARRCKTIPRVSPSSMLVLYRASGNRWLRSSSWASPFIDCAPLGIASATVAARPVS